MTEKRNKEVEPNMGGVVERTLGKDRANANPDGLWVIMRLILVNQL